MHRIITKFRAQELRRNGRTHREIAKELRISLGSVSLWTAGIRITDEQRVAIYKRRAGFSPEGRRAVQAAARLRGPLLRKYTDDDLIRQIRIFYQSYGRIPLKHEFNDYRIFRQRFGGWNKAIRKAGYKPNKSLFAKKFTAKDGHRCDSYTEMIIDDYFFDHAITHEVHVPYPVNPRFKVDFLINGMFVEFFGLAGEVRAYDRLLERKRELCKQENIPLIEIYPKDIYKKNRLPEILRAIQSAC